VIERMAEAGLWVVGTPDDCVAAIKRFQELTDGFGGFLVQAHEWAPREATLRSCELLARYVVPRFQGSLAGIESSASWATGHARDFRARANAAIEQAHQAYERRT
jgi:limonene 1,2-monooxygenase